MVGTLKIQTLVIGALSIALWATVGAGSALACAASGAAILVPHFITGLVLWVRAALTGQLSVVVLMGSEGLKLLLIIASLFGVRRWLGPDLAWGGFITGVLGALLAQWLTLWFTRKS